ncbi:MAG: DUF2270 domain-containing protein [Anaerolineae bacterium]
MNRTETEVDAVQAWTYKHYELDPDSFTTAMVHFYRAEVGRANLWRSRLDTTTNWAVVTAGAALTFTFSSPDNPHFVLLLVLILVLTFLLIEARRYSYYALWYYRVRLLETGFLGAMIVPPYAPPPGWGEALHATLEDPTFVTSRWRSAAIRYRRNYVWLVSLVLMSWLLKLSVHPVPAESLRELILRAAIGFWIPGPWVIGIVFAVYILLLGLIVALVAFPIQGMGHPARYQEGGAEVPEREQEQMALIVTNRRAEVSARLIGELQRGVTALSGTGMYTGEPRDVLFCALSSAQELRLRQIVREADPDAFVILTGARDIRGRGFAPTEPPT